MAHQDTTPQLKEDQPPAYPYNDKPPDYHDVCPRKTVSPPPVDIPSPENTPAVHIPLSTTTTAASSVVFSSYTTTTTTTSIANTRYPPENIVVTQPLSNNAHLDDVDEGNWHNILWKFLVVLSVIAAIIVPIIGIHACVHSCVGYHSEDPDVQKRSAIIAIVMCTISYVAVIVVVIVVPVTLA